MKVALIDCIGVQMASFDIPYLSAAIASDAECDLETLALQQAMRLIIGVCKLMCQPDIIAHGSGAACSAASSPIECASCNGCDRQEEFCDRLWDAGLLMAAKKELANLLFDYATKSICAANGREQAQMRTELSKHGCARLNKLRMDIAGDCAEINLAMRQHDALMRARNNPRGD